MPLKKKKNWQIRKSIVLKFFNIRSARDLYIFIINIMCKKFLKCINFIERWIVRFNVKKKNTKAIIYIPKLFIQPLFTIREIKIFKNHWYRGAAKRDFFRLGNHWLRPLVWKKIQIKKTENNEEITFRDWR